ncbi:MAG: AAA family ATPase [Myxococcota bacterium]
MACASTIHELKTLVLSFHPAIVFDTVEEERVEALADMVGAELDIPVWTWVMTRGLVRKPTAHPSGETKDPTALLKHLRSLRTNGIFLLKDFARHLQDPATCRAFRDAAQELAHANASMWVVGHGHEIPADAEAHVVHFPLDLPTKKELGEVVTTVVRSLRDRAKTRVELSRGDLDRLLNALSGLTLNQARQVVARAILKDGVLHADDIPEILSAKAEMLGKDGLLEYFPAEDNAWELGGFAGLKAWLERARVGFSPEAAELGLPAPRGILLAGIQGCGKSLAAKFVARSWGLPLVKLDAGSLYSKWSGESERNLRKVIQLAESMAPVVLWIDELEKSFASFGSGEFDGGTSQRIFATMLSWMQEKKKPVFLVATANDVFKLPPELMRKGRFDELFFVDLPGPAEREAIFGIHLARRKQQTARFDLPALAAASEGMSGAEIEQAVVASLYRSLHEKRPLDGEMLGDELAQTVPLSVTRREDITRLRDLAQGRFVPVV